MMELTLLHLLYFALINLALVLLGFVLIQRQTVLLSWMLLVVSIAAVYLIFLYEHPVLKMLALIATTFTAMKIVAVCEAYRQKAPILNFKQWFVFAVGWAGMRAQPFETLGGNPLPNAWPMIRFGVSRVIGGLLLILLSHGLVSLHLNNNLTYILVSPILLAGFSLILHFGFLSISAGSWRLSGANTYLLFKSPAKAMSLTEFWSKRWNVAFSEMTSIAIFRPLRPKIGSVMALMTAFAFSGLLHELALSVPVNSGYGLPLLYFIIQGVMVLLEKVLTDNKAAFLKNSILARVWTLFWVIGPAPLLFHTEFIKQIVWPLAGLHV
jgi:Membrane bound O-acyl transferase family